MVAAELLDAIHQSRLVEVGSAPAEIEVGMQVKGNMAVAHPVRATKRHWVHCQIHCGMKMVLQANYPQLATKKRHWVHCRDPFVVKMVLQGSVVAYAPQSELPCCPCFVAAQLLS